METINIRLAAFEGPLDLLYHLIEKNEIDNYNIYPFDIDLVKNFEKLNLSSPVTFFIGENGIGKSTFIEAIAIKCGLNPEG